MGLGGSVMVVTVALAVGAALAAMLHNWLPVFVALFAGAIVANRTGHR